MAQLPPGHKMPAKPKPKKMGTASHLLKAGAACGAKKKKGGTCTMAAGWGTNHPGLGRCKIHGGNTPTHVKSAIKDEYRILMGTAIEINPLDGLLMCIKICAGEVKWLSDKMADLNEKEWIEDTIVGKQFHLFSRERSKRLQDLARFSGMAISLGIAERAVKLAETYGEMLAQLIQGILGDLDLNEEQRAKVPSIVRRHLILLDGGVDGAVQPGEMLELKA